jgi:hypothetical protein
MQRPAAMNCVDLDGLKTPYKCKGGALGLKVIRGTNASVASDEDLWNK